MLVPETFATHFARTVELFRDRAARDNQKVQFRALLALLRLEAATLATVEGCVLVNGSPVLGEPLEPLLRVLALHGLSEIEIPREPPPAELFELLRALAAEPAPGGGDDIATRLRAAGVTRIAVGAAVSDPQSAVSPQPSAVDDRPSPGEAPTADARRAAGVVFRPSDAGPLPPEVAAVLAEEAAREAPVTPPPPPPQVVALPRPRPPLSMLLELERHPTAPNAGEMLVALGRHFAAAIKGDDFQQAMRILAGIVRCEQRVPAEQRRHFSVALKRLYSKPVLEQLAQRVTVPADHAEAVLALQGAGPDGVEVLLELLVAAPTIAERESVFRALTEMKEGADQLIRQLGHYQWYVVRNVAELVGELGLEEAVPALAKRLDHADERVRKAVGHALARIGTRAAAEPLRLVLRDRSPAVRLQAAVGIAGRKSNALVMMLVSLIEDEQDRDVQGELVQGLGRIGTPDAIQALIKLSHQPTRFFKRTPPWVRVAAVEALAVAATPAAIGTLQGLSGDFDKSVRQAAQEALAARKK